MKIYAKNLEQEALTQFKQCLSDESCIDGALMPDAHTGYTLPIGGVILNKNKIFPSYVGYDIGCGVCSVKTNLTTNDLGVTEVIFNEIYKNIPCGEGKGGTYKGKLKSELTDFGHKIFESNGNQIGTLGGGNHFIEIGYDEDDIIWVTIHSGSRGFGYKIADHYMKLAAVYNIDISDFEKKYEETNANVKKFNPEKYGENLQIAIEQHIKLKTKGECGGNNGFSLDSVEGKNYLKDMNGALEFALENRKLMMENVLKIIGAKEVLFINKNHNCADLLGDGLVLHRKGATSSKLGELGVIPGNMKDGTVIVKGKGNKDFLECSSHGAGRILSRKKAQEQILLEDFKVDMEGIIAKVEEGTKDESRFAYKNFKEVLDLQKDSIEILHIIKPLINIKG